MDYKKLMIFIKKYRINQNMYLQKNTSSSMENVYEIAWKIYKKTLHNEAIFL